MLRVYDLGFSTPCNKSNGSCDEYDTIGIYASLECIQIRVDASKFDKSPKSQIFELSLQPLEGFKW